jgi:hypothetical protein
MRPAYSQQVENNYSYTFLKSLELNQLCELLSDKTLELLTAKADKDANETVIPELKAIVEKIQAIIISRKNDLRSL